MDSLLDCSILSNTVVSYQLYSIIIYYFKVYLHELLIYTRLNNAIESIRSLDNLEVSSESPNIYLRVYLPYNCQDILQLSVIYFRG